MVENSVDYAYSSYHAYISDWQEEIVSNSTVLGAFAEKVFKAQMLYKAFVEGPMECESPFQNVYVAVSWVMKTS